MSLLLYIILANVVISLFSIVGVVTILINDYFTKKVTFGLIGLSTGTLIGGAFLHLLPRALITLNVNQVFLAVLVSFIVFFVIEKVFHWHHCHNGDCEVHTVGYMNLLGDGVHNFIDGMTIAAAFTVDIKLGLFTSLAIMFHEIPQEVGDFAVLLYAGFDKLKAIFYNLAVALLSVLGGIAGYFFINAGVDVSNYLLPFAAGGFIYISMSDLLPEIKSETSLSKSFFAFSLFLVGVAIMYGLTFFE